MGIPEIKITPHLTDARFKADLDECVNHLTEHALSLLVFLGKTRDDLENLDPEEFTRSYVAESSATLDYLLNNIAELGRSTLDRLTARHALLTVREETRGGEERQALNTNTNTKSTQP